MTHNPTHLAVLTSIQKLKAINTSIRAIPNTKAAGGEELSCKNCQVFTRQLTKMSLENQRLQGVSEESGKMDEEFRSLEELHQLKCEETEILREEISKL